MNNPVQNSLAAHFRSQDKLLVYSEMPLGSVVKNSHTPRADVLTLTKSYSPRIRIYEVKVSKGDFNSDVQSGKYEKYFPFCHQLYFAAPRGLLSVKDVPDGCGLITLNEETGWHVAKAPQVRSMESYSSEMLLACLFRGQEQEIEGRRLAERIRLEENVELRDAAVNLGWRIRQRLGGGHPELEQIQKAKESIDEFLGEETRSLDSALWNLQQYLRDTFPGLENLTLAQEMLMLARQLVSNSRGSLEEWGSFRRISQIVKEREADGSA